MNAELVTTLVNVTISVYSDGVPESEEGFVLLFGVLDEDLDSDDVGFVNVLNPVILVRLEEGGNEDVACDTR